MVYYLVLFGVCVLVGLVVLWLYKEASTIDKIAKNKGVRAASADPTVHLKGVAMKTAINDTTRTWSGQGSPARVKTGLPSRPNDWDLPEEKQRSLNLHAFPDGSKSESEFWSYLLPSDRPGHGTGVKPGHGRGG